MNNMMNNPMLHTSYAVIDVVLERQRQIDSECYTTKHDDELVNEELAAMATFYAMPTETRETLGKTFIPKGWKVTVGDRRDELVKAGALILAEIERLDRENRGL